MSRLLLVRHGQASFDAHPERAFEDYDKLSELGRQQAIALGEELVAGGVTFDRIYSGPLRRQRETADRVGEAFERLGEVWPGVVELPELAEHEGSRVVRHALSTEAEHQDALQRLLASTGEDGEEMELMRTYFTVFRRVTRRWARGEIAPPGVEESWKAFRSRVESGMRRIMDESGKGATVGAFTSGGPVGSTVAWTLGLDDEQALELAWMVENATVTEILFSGDRVSLKSFNVQPRIGAAEMVTGV
ncbi:MAG: histidine phosphatase family protein [Gemmatimonadota bacterium]|jgi:broad specificity phosphatase PhoE